MAKQLCGMCLWVGLSLFVCMVTDLAEARTLVVGPDKEFIFPSVAAQFAEDGDVIEIDAAGLYQNDHAVWKQNNITIKGVNGRPHLRSFGLIPNQKGVWVIQGNGVAVANVEISGAKVKDGNGAAIRLEGQNFHLSDCFIHDNENGILSGVRQPQSEVLIENCEFSLNGAGDGYTHNIYIGEVGKFTLRNSYSHNAIVGQNVKSRARENYILHNWLFEGTTSYAVDLSNGGYGLVMGNILYQGDETENWAVVTFGPEGFKYPNNMLEVVYNTFLSERSSGGVFVKAGDGAEVKIVNNIFGGNAELFQGKKDKARIENNVREKEPYDDFSPKNIKVKESMMPKIVDTAIPVTNVRGGLLVPLKQGVAGVVRERKRLGKSLDIGAVEYR
jgi:hypothetical protein